MTEFIKRVGKTDIVQGFAEHNISFTDEFNKFSIKWTRMLDSIYHITLEKQYYRLSAVDTVDGAVRAEARYYRLVPCHMPVKQQTCVNAT